MKLTHLLIWNKIVDFLLLSSIMASLIFFGTVSNTALERSTAPCYHTLCGVILKVYFVVSKYPLFSRTHILRVCNNTVSKRKMTCVSQTIFLNVRFLWHATHVKLPYDFVHSWFGIDTAFKVDIITLFDAIRIQSRAKSKLNPR